MNPFDTLTLRGLRFCVELVTFLHSPRSIHGFEGSDQSPVLEKIIDAYSEGDTEALKKCCGDAVFKTMDNEVC